MDLSRLVTAIVVGLVTGFVIYVLGAILVEVNLESIGHIFEGVATIAGFIAALYYFFTGQRAV